jgi:hypothetical protein
VFFADLEKVMEVQALANPAGAHDSRPVPLFLDGFQLRIPASFSRHFCLIQATWASAFLGQSQVTVITVLIK